MRFISWGGPEASLVSEGELFPGSQLILGLTDAIFINCFSLISLSSKKI